jgi:hypothetical protein
LFYLSHMNNKIQGVLNRDYVQTFNEFMHELDMIFATYTVQPLEKDDGFAVTFKPNSISNHSMRGWADVLIESANALMHFMRQYDFCEEDTYVDHSARRITYVLMVD